MWLDESDMCNVDTNVIKHSTPQREGLHATTRTVPLQCYITYVCSYYIRTLDSLTYLGRSQARPPTHTASPRGANINLTRLHINITMSPSSGSVQKTTAESD